MEYPQTFYVNALVALCILPVSFLLWSVVRQVTGQYARLPPGPPPHFLFGNLGDMPKHHSWLTFTKWAQKYGSVVHVRVFGNPMIILNTAQAATDLLEKHSSIYSDRPRLVMAREMMGWDHSTALMGYGPIFRRHRLAMQSALNRTTITTYHHIQEKEASLLLQRILDTPQDFAPHIRRAIVSTIMMITYGHEITSDGDPFIALAEEGVKTIVSASRPGAFMVEWLPFLKYVPEWMPFAGYQSFAREGRKLARSVLELPFQMVENKVADGTATPCYVTHLLAKHKHDGPGAEEELEIIKATASVQYGAGVDTLVSLMSTLILCMTLYPDVQKKAQQELDSFLKNDRLPTLTDLENTPYLNATIKEALRWRNPTPVGVSHRLMEDHEYNGMFMPSGSVVVVNHWAMLHDETMYPDPWSFNPERFLQTPAHPPEADPRNIGFGHGRRVCPGRYLAENTLWMTAAALLTCFNILPPVDAEGKRNLPKVEYTGTGIVSHPLEFQCRFEPRTKEKVELIRAADAAYH